ncbi:MAG: hypothetical protein Q7T21_07585 [Gallionella sp.]|nr:hypothetical protein [Gallionella sp.]
MNRNALAMIFATTFIGGCGGGGGGVVSTVADRTTTGTGMRALVSVAVSGLASNGLTLQNNGLDNLIVSSNGSFTFVNKVPSGSPYAVTILTQPTGQACAVTNGSGTVSNANISNVTVVCSGGGTPTATTYKVGGSVSGLTASGLVMQNNLADYLSLSASGGFNFSGRLSSGASYSISILSQPVGQTCTVTNGAGVVGSADISNIAVTCVGGSGKTTNISLGGVITGLSATGLGLNVTYGAFGSTFTDNYITYNGTFSLMSWLNTGDSYSVSVATQPAGQVCTVSNGSGTVGNSDISSLSVSCTGGSGTLMPTYYYVHAVINGLTTNGLALSIVGFSGSGAYTSNVTSTTSGMGYYFQQPTDYSMTIQTQPTGQTCTVLNGVGVVSSAAPVNIEINCI